MKKLFLLILFFLYFYIYAQGNEKNITFEAWGGLGFCWENNFIPQNTLSPNEIPAKSLIGLNTNFYVFLNDKAIGFFQSPAFFIHLPLEKRNVYYPCFQMDYSLGVAYHYHIKDTLTLFFGIGGNINFTQGFNWNFSENGETIEYNTGQQKFGGALDIGLKLDISSKTYISFGSTLIYDFVIKKTNAFNNYNSNDDWHQYRDLNINYGLLRIRPYIAFGSILKRSAKVQLF
jgi:hypothetical protein